MSGRLARATASSSAASPRWASRSAGPAARWRAGVEVLHAGAVVTTRAVGLLAAVGAATVSVRRRPVVAVVTTGDELVPPDAAPGPGQIRDANGPALAAQVVAAGGVPLSLHARDDRQSLADALDRASEADVLVFAGGVSMGERDLVRPELERRGVRWAFWKVRQRPGKPLAFGALGGRPVIGLPGNPVSAVVGFEVYVRPLLAACLGRPEAPEPGTGRLAQAIAKAEGLTTFLRVTAARSASGELVLSAGGGAGLARGPVAAALRRAGVAPGGRCRGAGGEVGAVRAVGRVNPTTVRSNEVGSRRRRRPSGASLRDRDGPGRLGKPE